MEKHDTHMRPRAPIRCHALSTLRASWRRMAQHDSSYWAKTRRMGRQRGKLGSWQCGRVGRHMLTTSQGNESQNEPQHQQGVTRPQLILALVSAEILRMRSRSPSSGRTKSTLMLVKRLSLWWREVFLTMYCLPPNSWKWALGGGALSLFLTIWSKSILKHTASTLRPFN